MPYTEARLRLAIEHFRPDMANDSSWRLPNCVTGAIIYAWMKKDLDSEHAKILREAANDLEIKGRFDYFEPQGQAMAAWQWAQTAAPDHTQDQEP